MEHAQRKGCVCDEGNDIFGFGIILFECATLKKMKNLEMHLAEQKQLVELRYVLEQIPKSMNYTISTLIEICLDKAKREKITFSKVKTNRCYVPLNNFVFEPNF